MEQDNRKSLHRDSRRMTLASQLVMHRWIGMRTTGTLIGGMLSGVKSKTAKQAVLSQQSHLRQLACLLTVMVIT